MKNRTYRHYRLLRARLRRLYRDDRGATMLEWCLLLAAIAVPSLVLINYGLALLSAHHGLVTTLNQMPF